MRITIHGAGGGEVTGSAYLLETDRAKNNLCAKHTELFDEEAHVFLTHGEARGRDPLKRIIQDRFKLNVDSPEMFETIEI